MSRYSLKEFQKIVVKIGSSLLVDEYFELKQNWLSSLAADLATLTKRGCQVLLVSSGAIALGRNRIRTFDSELATGRLELRESQAAAAIGQISLSSYYANAFTEYGMKSAQILLTVGDTEERRRYLNARATIDTLLEWDVIPIINENDTVATTEIRYGDNDRLSARVASMIDADLLILLSDVEGLFTAPPYKDPTASLVEEVTQIDKAILAMAGEAASDVSQGGMKTKIEAARIATAAGLTMVIADGRQPHAIKQLDEKGRGTWFLPQSNSRSARKKWIAGGLNLAGRLLVDAGAMIALRAGKSLLPAGVTSIDGNFNRGDTVVIVGPDGDVIGRGLVEYDLKDAKSMIGLQSADIRKLFGEHVRSELIHRDNLVVDSE